MLNNLGEQPHASGPGTASLQARSLRALGARAQAVAGMVYVAREDWVQVAMTVREDPRASATSLGFLLGGNGNTILVPAWTLDLTKVGRARAVARLRATLKKVLS